jgi:hypothetical protein
MDIRQVLSDNAIKDMLQEEDSKFIGAVNTAVGAAGTSLTASSHIHHVNVGLAVDSRDNLWDALKIMPGSPFHLETHTVLVNNLLIKEISKLDRTELGGDLSEDIMKNGWSEQNFMGVRWIITIKTDLVGDAEMYMFSDPKFIGKHYQLEDTTMHIKREAYMLEFFAYETAGATLGHVGGLAKATFA